MAKKYLRKGDLALKRSVLFLEKQQNGSSSTNIDKLLARRDLAHNDIYETLQYSFTHNDNEETQKRLQRAAQDLEDIFLYQQANFPERNHELLIAALAYYLAGYYARAFVLMQGVPRFDSNQTDLMRLTFLRKLNEVREVTLQTLNHEQFRDIFLANLVDIGEIKDLDALDFALEGTLNRVYSLFYEFARTGKIELINLVDSPV